MKLSTTKQVLKDNNKFHTLYVPNASFKKLRWWTLSLGSLFSHSMPSVHQNKSFGKASLWQIKCVFPTLTRCFKHSSLAALLHKHALILGCPPSKRRIQNRSALFPALTAWQFGLHGFWNSGLWILLILDKLKMTHEDKGKIERAMYFLPHTWTPKH